MIGFEVCIWLPFLPDWLINSFLVLITFHPFQNIALLEIDFLSNYSKLNMEVNRALERNEILVGD